MARNFFDNLPSTRTPVEASRMNALLDGDEPMGNIVVDSIQAKNILNSDNPNGIATGITWTGSGKTHYYTSTTTFNGGINWFIPVKSGEKYTFSYKQRNNQNVYLYIQERSSKEWTSGNILKQIVNDGTNTSYSFTIENDSYLSIAFQNNQTVSNVLIEEIQLEKGLTKTNFSLYKGLGYVSGHNTNGYFIKYDDGTLMQWGSKTVTTGTTSTTIGGVATYNGNTTATFPISFLNSDISISAQVEGGSGVLSWIYTISSTASATLTLQSTSSNYQRTIKWIAIGKWK